MYNYKPTTTLISKGRTLNFEMCLKANEMARVLFFNAVGSLIYAMMCEQIPIKSWMQTLEYY